MHSVVTPCAYCLIAKKLQNFSKNPFYVANIAWEMSDKIFQIFRKIKIFPEEVTQKVNLYSHSFLGFF